MTHGMRRFEAPAPPQPTDPFSGVLLVDKPMGPTSHDIVHRIRRTFKIKKVGHGGTLDPMATGLLILLLGKGTKLSDRFLGADKTYAGTLRLGVTTNSQDAQGEVTAEADPSGITESQVTDAMARRVGDSMQTPPMVSAVKVNGVPLYKHARKGKEVARKPRLIHVYQFQCPRFELPDADFVMRCTKGTYVRKLCHDIGAELGCGAHLTRLRRTQCGHLSIVNALPMDTLMQMDHATLAKHILPMRTFT